MPPIFKYPLRILIGIIAILGVFGFVKIDQVAKGQGRLIPANEIWIGAGANAPINAVRVQEGQRVAPGDTLAEFKSDIAAARLAATEHAYKKAIAEMEGARAALEALEAPPLIQEYATLQSELDALREKSRLADRGLSTVRKLMNHGGLVSTNELEEAIADSIIAAAQIAKLKASIEMLEIGPIEPLKRKTLFELRAKEAQVAQVEAEVALVRHELDNHTILAPIGGRVLMILCKPEIVPAIGDTLLLLGTDGEALVECRIPSEFGPWLKPGQEVTLWPEWEKWYEFTGTVKKVRQYVEEKSSPSVLVHVALESQPPLIYGDRVHVEVKLRRASILRLLFAPFDWANANGG